jgi:membrane protease YdiL (CAAX protease family)
VRILSVVVVLLAVRNVAGEALVPSTWYVPVNAGLAAVLLLIARRSHLSWAELGLAARSVRRGLALGAVIGGLIAVGIAVVAAVPVTRPLFEDQRMAAVDGRELVYRALVRIPFGTAVLEEVAFRGVLLAMLSRLVSTAGAVGVSSALFGLWHIRPTLGALDANDVAGHPLSRLGALAGAVAVTAAAGALFCRLRLATESLLAPMVVHAVLNSASAVAAYMVLDAR